MRGALRRTSSHASYSCENSRSRPISVSASKRRSHRSDTCPAGCGARRRPSRSRSAIRTRSALGLAPSSSASRASNRPNALSALVRSPTHARASINPRTASSDRGSRSSSTCAWRSTVAKSPVRRPASICFTRQSRIRDCLVKQMDAGRRTGDFTTVERHAQVLLDLDPLSEDAVRGLIEARAWVGDRTNALKAFGRFEARLAEELGAKPSADLVRIADLLREGRRRAPHPAGQVSERCERRFEAETLIGREREFSQLYDAWLDVRRSAPRIVVLVGDPGVGKTTLTNAFVSTCQMEGAAIARAQAYDAERELPFAVLAELVKQLTLQRAIGGADPEALSELTRVAPEVFTMFPGVPKPVEWAAEVIPLRLADGFLKAVQAATEESPLVLVVDDVHAADNATVAILHIVARKLPRTRLLVILTARSNELRMVAGPSALMSDSSIEAMRTLEREPLSGTAAEQLVAAVVTKAEGRVADVPVPRILLAGNGNPLALELLTKEWLAHGSSSLLSDLEALNTQPVANIGIPRAIGAVFDRQIRRLDAATRAALDLAAVLGRRLADLPLYEVVELSSSAAGEALSRRAPPPRT